MTEVLWMVLQCGVYASIISLSRYKSFIWSWLAMTVWLYCVGTFGAFARGLEGCLKIQIILTIYLSAIGFCAAMRGYMRMRMRRGEKKEDHQEVR